jgi:hypothetical protein
LAFDAWRWHAPKVATRWHGDRVDHKIEVSEGYVEALRLANERLKRPGWEVRSVIDTAWENDRPARQSNLNLAQNPNAIFIRITLPCHQICPLALNKPWNSFCGAGQIEIFFQRNIY